MAPKCASGWRLRLIAHLAPLLFGIHFAASQNVAVPSNLPVMFRPASSAIPGVAVPAGAVPGLVYPGAAIPAGTATLPFTPAAGAGTGVAIPGAALPSVGGVPVGALPGAPAYFNVYGGYAGPVITGLCSYGCPPLISVAPPTPAPTPAPTPPTTTAAPTPAPTTAKPETTPSYVAYPVGCPILACLCQLCACPLCASCGPGVIAYG